MTKLLTDRCWKYLQGWLYSKYKRRMYENVKIVLTQVWTIGFPTKCVFRIFFRTKSQKIRKRYHIVWVIYDTIFNRKQSSRWRRSPGRKHSRYNELGRRQNMKRTETAVTGMLTIRCHNVDSNNGRVAAYGRTPARRRMEYDDLAGFGRALCPAERRTGATAAFSLEIDADDAANPRTRTDWRQRYD